MNIRRITRYFLTFAAMKSAITRCVASWTLLAVFLPMLFLSSFHVHESRGPVASECAECVAHHCHGHLGQMATSLGDCVLCHFLALTFVASAAIAATLIFNVRRVQYVLPASAVCHLAAGLIVTRGPPSA